jgi:hypothetical protein
MNRFSILKNKDTLSVLGTPDVRHNSYTVWFFGNKCDLLKGTRSGVLDNCVHRTFDTQEEFEDTLLQPLINEGWEQLNR